MDNNGHDDQGFSKLLAKKVKREKNKGTLVVGADNAMGISMTITEQVCLSSSNLSDLAQCLTVNQKSRILRIFAVFCGFFADFLRIFCGILWHFATFLLRSQC